MIPKSIVSIFYNFFERVKVSLNIIHYNFECQGRNQPRWLDNHIALESENDIECFKTFVAERNHDPKRSLKNKKYRINDLYNFVNNLIEN